MRSLTHRLSLTALALCLGIGTAQAREVSPISTMLAEQGLAATEAALSTARAPTAEERFALGGVRFLRAIERAVQMRYRMNMGDVGAMPILRLPVPPNPDPEPFRFDAVADLFTGALADLDGAGEALDGIEAGETFGLRIALGDLWFDIDASGTRDPGEDLFDVVGLALAVPIADDGGALEVRFDTADAAWLRAYVHLLSAVSHGVLAVDPTEATERVYGALEALDTPGEHDWLTPAIDQFAVALLALRQTPDARHTRAVLAELEGMVARNRDFWRRVAEETDDEAEWIPNAKQTSAFGIEVSREMAQGWVDVLGEIDLMLKGELLMPFWRVQDGRGIDLRAYLTDPTPLDPVLWIQGAGALPFLKEGKVASGATLRTFEQLVGGRAPLYAVWFN